MKRGELYYADLDPVIGSEQGGMRPVLIIQNDLGNRFSPTVIVLPLTSKVNKTPLRTHVPLLPPQGGVRKPSVILCEQVRTVEKIRLTKRLGVLSPEKMALVEKALAAAVGVEGEEDEPSGASEAFSGALRPRTPNQEASLPGLSPANDGEDDESLIVPDA